MSSKSDIIIVRHYADPAAPDFERDQEIVAEALARMLTPKGRQIREYILDHNLPDGDGHLGKNGKYRVICKNCHEDLTTGYISYPKLAGQEMK